MSSSEWYQGHMGESPKESFLGELFVSLELLHSKVSRAKFRDFCRYISANLFNGSANSPKTSFGKGEIASVGATILFYKGDKMLIQLWNNSPAEFASHFGDAWKLLKAFAPDQA
jgi:hypothetical protein